MKKIIIFLILFVIFTLIFIIFEYKNIKSGNTITDTDILNISSYEATVEIEVHSNKNTNKYIIKQQYSKPDHYRDEVIEPTNFAGLTIQTDGKDVTLTNKKLELTKLYENFAGDILNLTLTSFSQNYKTDTNAETTDTADERIMCTKIKNSTNKYQMYQRLYIDKRTNLPTKMEILDNNQNATIYILYKEIELK